MRKVDSELSSFQRFQVWFGRNALILTTLMLIVVFLALIVTFISVKNSAKREVFYRKVIEQTTQYALVATPDGRIVEVSKKPLGNILKNYIRSSVVNYFILDRNSFLDKNDSPILANPNSLSRFLKTLIAKSEEIQKLSSFFDKRNSESVKSFYGFLKYLYGLAKGGSLPDLLKVSNVKNDSFEKNGSSFTYRGIFDVKLSYVGIDGKWHYGKAPIEISMKGYFNPLSADEYNPYGMKVNEISVKWVKTY